MQHFLQIRIFLFLYLLCCLVTAQAQDSGSERRQHGFDPEQRTERMAQDLRLHSTQIAQVREINHQTSEKIQSARSSGGRSAMRKKMQAIFEEQDKAMQAVLDSGQWEKYQSMKQERPRRRP